MQMTQRRALVVAFLMLVPACWAAAQDVSGTFEFIGPDTSCFLSLDMYNPDNPDNPYPVSGAYTYIYQLRCLLDDNFIDTLTLPVGGRPRDVFVIEAGELDVIGISVEARKITFTFPTYTTELTNPMVVISPLKPNLGYAVLTGVFEAVTGAILAPLPAGDRPQR